MSMIGYFKPATIEEINDLNDDKKAQEKFLVEAGATNIDKTFDIIHFTLTGKKYGSGSGAMSIEPFGVQHLEADMGYGPGSYLEPDELKIAAAHLENIGMKKFEIFIDAEQLVRTGAYGINEGDDDKAIIEYASPYYQKLRDLYLEAAKNDQGMIFWVM